MAAHGVLEALMSERWLQEQHPAVGTAFAYQVDETNGRVVVSLRGEKIEFEVVRGGSGEGWCRWNGKLYAFALAWAGDDLHLWLDGTAFALKRSEPAPLHAPSTAAAVASEVRTPMPGKVLRVLVHVGDTVDANQEVLAIESMKMEHVFKAPRQGVISRVRVQPGDRVDKGAVLLEMET